MKQYQQLPRVAFSILLALSLKDRHGYEIIKQVEADSDGKIKLSPGALYASIKQLLEQDLIAKAQFDGRRRYYRLTNQGRVVLAGELNYYHTSLKLARERQVIRISL